MDIRNVIIIGSGPAALTAALYNARADLKPLVLAGVKWGGQLMLTTDVENYPGFVDGILGPELMEKFRHQAERFGAEIATTDVTAVDFSNRPFLITADDKAYKSKAVIIATGAETNWLGLANEQRLIGRGISSCAPCDAFFFRDKKVVVVGGGDSAMEEALTLTKFATEVTIVHRRDEFRASKIMVDRAKANKKISFILNSEVVDILGKDKVSGVKIKNKPGSPVSLPGLRSSPAAAGLKDGSTRDLAVDGMFVAIGHHPMTDIFKGQVELDEKGYVVRKSQGHPRGGVAPAAHPGGGEGSFKMMTSVPGVFVAGDVHDYHYRQAVTAAGYGCAAAIEAEKWLEAQND
ncbi:thioredoxin-disulfide reductase [Candidatus Curtissbacteria bacterium]|nr:thioredoxin-disulfide reductase [Candidatus Curtissbacteria bacterium]